MNAPKEKYKKTLRARYLREMRILLLKSMSLPGGQRKRHALQELSSAFPRILAVLVLRRLAVLAQLGCAALEHFAALHQDGALRVLSIRNKKKVSCF